MCKILSLNSLDELLRVHSRVDNTINNDWNSWNTFFEFFKSCTNGEFGGINRYCLKVEFIDGNTLEFALLILFIFKFCEVIETFADHPFFAHELGDVVSEMVWKDTDDADTLTEVVFFSVSDSGIDDLAAGTTTEETFFLNESSGHDETGNVGVLHPFVYDSSMKK